MIPEFVIVPGALWPLLPAGIHGTTMQEIYERYVTNQQREQLFDGLKKGLDHLFTLGSPLAFLDGSYVTAKPLPNDYEVVWDIRNVDPNLLDPVFMDLSDGRKAQKQKYLGEYFPSIYTEGVSGKPFVDFFQQDHVTGAQKGILQIFNYINGGGNK